jgi:MFS family permease
MLASALQFSVLGTRASAEGFSSLAIGIMSSAYFAGYVVGGRMATGWIVRVGHVRTFSALASLASVVILLQAMVVDPTTWTAGRFASGVCMAGMVVAVESWLNGVTDSSNRGRVLSGYMVVMLTAQAIGQLGVGAGDPAGFSLFAVASMLLSLSLLPVLLGVTSPPEIPEQRSTTVGQLFSRAPVGLVAAFIGGFGWAVLVSMVLVFGLQLGLTVQQSALLASSPVFGGVLLQFPVGWASDHLDRRVVIAALGALATAVALVAAIVGDGDRFALLLVVTGLLGGALIPLYSLAIAHTADRLDHDEIIPASATLLIVSSGGSIVGPLTTSVGIELAGPAGLFLVLAVVSAAGLVFTLYRVTRLRPAGPSNPYVPVGNRATPVGVWIAAEELYEEELDAG